MSKKLLFDEQEDQYKKFEDDLKDIREALLMLKGLRPISSFISEAEDLSDTVTELRPDCRGHLMDRLTVCIKFPVPGKVLKCGNDPVSMNIDGKRGPVSFARKLI